MARIRWSLLLLVLSTALYAQEEWESMGGPGGDIINQFTVAPNGDFYAVSEALHKSTDKGKTWKRVAHEVSLVNPSTSKVASQKGGALYLGTARGVWKSLDNGNSWVNVLMVTRLTTASAVEIAVSDQGTVVYLADSLRISNDGGISWRTEKRFTTRASKVYVDLNNVFYVIGDYPHRSTNQGASWARLMNGWSPRPFYDLKAFSKDSVMVVNDEGIQVSGDNGRTWVNKAMLSGHYARLAAAGNTIYMMDNNLVIKRSVNAGATWEIYDESFKVVGAKSPNILYHNGNLYVIRIYDIRTRSLANPNWEVHPLHNGVVTSLIIHSTGRVFALTTPRSSDAYQYGKLWYADEINAWQDCSSLYTQLPQYYPSLNSMTIDSSGGIRVLAYGVFLSSTDRGITWTSAPSSTNLGGKLVVNNGGMIFLYGMDGVFRSVDNGVTWDQLNEGFPDINITALSTADNGLMYAAGTQHFYRSTNYGFTWAEEVFPFILGTEAARSITHVGNKVVVGADKSGVYFSNDQGFFWENHSTGLRLDTINQVLLTPDGDVVAATSTGLYEFGETAQAWYRIGGTDLAGNILTLALAPDGRLYAGTAGGGVYRSVKPYKAQDKPDVNAHTGRRPSDEMSLYPNPASAELHIEFPEAGNYRILIYNILGEACLAQTSEGKSATLDVSSLANGKYFLRLTGDKTVTRQFVVRN